MADYIDWPGKSGSKYRYYWCGRVADSILAVGGNYMFVKSGSDGWYPVYIGVAENLSTRISTHERWADAVANGATHVMAHTSSDANTRLTEERDLIQLWCPPCNTHHKPAA